MRRETQDAAEALRRALVLHAPTPAAFRTALDTIPADDRDAWLDLVLDMVELPDDDPNLPRGCVPYLPCAVGTVLEALRAATVTSDDVFVDVGAGLGRATALSSMLTGATCIGLEIQPALVQAARQRSAALHLARVRFIEGDAADRMCDASDGTVFFLYCPFGGERLERVLDGLHALALKRPLRICCVGMPALERSWVTPLPSTSVDLMVYRTHAHPECRPPQAVVDTSPR